MKRITSLLALGLVVSVAWSLDLSAGLAQEEVPAYAHPDSQRDAHWRGERQRRADVARQVGTIEYLRWLNGLPATVPLRGPLAADRAAYYAYGRQRMGNRRLTIFEPWPYLPGDIWGFDDDRTVPQSVGQRQVQTGPNRWVSYPVYADAPRPARSGPHSY